MEFRKQNVLTSSQSKFHYRQVDVIHSKQIVVDHELK